MRPFYALLAACAGTTHLACAGADTPVAPPPPVTAPAGGKPASGVPAPVVPAAPAAGTKASDQPPVLIVKIGGAMEGDQNLQPGAGDDDADGHKRMPDAQRDAQRAAQREERRLQNEARLREMLGNFGITKSDTQDAIIAYLAQVEASRGPLRDATRKLAFSLRRDAPPERLKEVLDNYKKAVAADNARRDKAQSDLDAKIGFSRDPHLEGFLLVSGMIGDASGQGAMSIFMLGRGPNTPRDGAAGNPGARPFAAPMPPQGYNGSQKGTVTGIVQKKDATWIEVREENGAVTQYFASYKPELRGFDPRGLALVAQANVGQRVQIEWFWLEKRRILNLSVVPDATTSLKTVAPDQAQLPKDAPAKDTPATPTAPGAPLTAPIAPPNR